MFVIEDCYFGEDKKLEICLSRNVFPKEPTFQGNEAHCSLQVIAIPYSEGDCRAVQLSIPLNISPWSYPKIEVHF